MKAWAIIGSFLWFGFTLLLTGCGSTSSIKPATGQRMEFTKYDRLLVETFKDEFSNKAKPVDRPKKQAEADVSCKMFAERIAAVVKASDAFREVVRDGLVDTNTLVVAGAITRYEEGSAALRLWIGMGAGSSYFDARVDLLDGTNNAVMGSWIVDKNSWGLGGAIASGQTPEEFMKAAAEKIGNELIAAKKAGFFAPKAEKPKTARQPHQ